MRRRRRRFFWHPTIHRSTYIRQRRNIGVTPVQTCAFTQAFPVTLAAACNLTNGLYNHVEITRMKRNLRLPSLLAAAALGLAGSLPSLGSTLTKDLVAHLTFDNDYRDSSGRGNHGTPVGSPTRVPGKVGANALSFSTIPELSEFNYVTLLDSNSLLPADLQFGDATDFTTAFWLKIGGHTGDPSFIANKNWGSGGNIGFVVATDGDGRIQWNYKEVDNGRKDYDGPGGTLNNGAWHHVALVVERAGNIRTYVDSVEVNSSPARAATELASSIDTADQGLGFNIGQDGTGTYTDGVITNSLIDDVGVWRRALAAGEIFRVYDSGLKNVDIMSIVDQTTPSITRVSPSDGQAGAAGGVVATVVIENGTTQLDPASVKLSFDGAAVVHNLTQSGATNTITYDPPGLLAPKSVHSYQLIFADNGSPVTWKTNTFTFTVADYISLTLPAPLYLETFDTTAEGQIPTGWTRSNFTSGATGEFDLNNAASDSYLDWLVLSRERIRTNASWNGSARLQLPDQYVNGVLIESLISNNCVYAESDSRGGDQIQYLFTSNYNLAGKSNVYVSYWSTYTQNQDSLGAAEYSVDNGATWLPIVYMVKNTTVLTNGQGAVDAWTTLTTPVSGLPTWTDPNTFETRGGFYGEYIGVASNLWSTLAPYISGRLDDNQSESKRVELFRLPQADNQATVKFRFAQAGTGSWFWGIDNLGLYSISAAPPQVTGSTLSGGNLTITWTADAATRLETTSSLGGTPTWTTVPETLGAGSATVTVGTTGNAFYRLRKD